MYNDKIKNVNVNGLIDGNAIQLMTFEGVQGFIYIIFYIPR